MMSICKIPIALTLLQLCMCPISAEDSVFTEHVSIHANHSGATNDAYYVLQRAMYNGTSVSISVLNCDGVGQYTVHWMIRYTECYNDDDKLPSRFFKNSAGSSLDGETKFWYYSNVNLTLQTCGGPTVPLADESDKQWMVHPPKHRGTKHGHGKNIDRIVKTINKYKTTHRDNSTVVSMDPESSRVTKTIRDGNYILIVYIDSFTDEDLQVELEVKLQSVRTFPPKYPNAVVPFYVALCGVYVIQTVMWLNLVIRNYRHVLRIHNLMTGVLVISVVQSLAIFIHQERVNIWVVTSVSVDDIFIGVIETAKIMLSLLFMILFSLGDGITKPNLGKCSFRCVMVVLGTFGLFNFSLSIYRLYHDDTVIIGALVIIVVLLGSVLILWIAHNLVDAMRQLHLQREISKMCLYICITIGLIAYGLTNIVYLAMYFKQTPTCITTAWPILFNQGALLSLISSAFLCFIMILIRPTVTNLQFMYYKSIPGSSETNGANCEPLLEQQKHLETAV